MAGFESAGAEPESVVALKAGFAGAESVVTSMAGFAGAESVVTSMAGFGPRRPRLPGGWTSIPAALR